MVTGPQGHNRVEQWRTRQPLGAPEQSLDPKHHFTRREGLHDVIVGTGLQPDQTIFLFATCRQHDHAGMISAAPPATQQLQAGQAGQHDVEDDDIRADPLPELRGLAAVAAPFHLVSGPGEIGP
jgi:hypothetical protein